MKELKAWHEDDRFWEKVSPIVFGQHCRESTAPQINQLTALLGLEPPMTILDLCCGLGRHSMELARRGFIVTGVDRTAVYLEKAKKQAGAENLPIEFIREDMRQFCRPDTFDVVLNFYTSFGYFENPAEDQRVLVNMEKSLKPGGRLVMDMAGKEILARLFRERDWHEDDGVIWLEERKVSKDWTWIDNRWILLRGDKRDEFRVSHRLYSAAELAALLKDCGFQSVDIFGNLAGAPYDHTAERLVVVAHKRRE
ncbi:MAG TPA: class I SAM-dependent methyltransferase [Verrucomicrobiae bacterium]|nr:class I SAM-dependent methyltransferase [Verrucomicrobiae bacterium]